MNLLAISGSTRLGSRNTGLAYLVGELRLGHQLAVVTDLDRLPFYDADVEALGTPPVVAELRSTVAAADADPVAIVTPDYNGTVPGVLGNAVDWLSRPRGQSVLPDKPVLVLSASPSRLGGVRAADHLRTVLSRIGAKVTPSGSSVPMAHESLGGRVEPLSRSSTRTRWRRPSTSWPNRPTRVWPWPRDRWSVWSGSTALLTNRRTACM
jgi:chromate reductase